MRTFLTTLFITLLTGGVANAQYAGQALATGGSGAGGQSNASAAAIATLVRDSDPTAKKFDYKSDDFAGSPYTNNNFIPTEIYYEDEKMGDFFYRYNALNQEVELKKTGSEEEPVQALQTDKKITIKVEGKDMSFKTFTDQKDNTLNGYLIKLYDGDTYDLYKRIKVKFSEGSPAQNSFVAATPNRFTHFTEYYFQKDGVNRIDEIPSRDRKFLKMLSEEEKQEVKTILKEKGYSLKEEQELIGLFRNMNM
ncbi:hypothetical protein [Robertkochia aurantiaca]|uniref:hypothetical protein n=1 Tax=Robertkochia aurantiaca TaxID=2873700 RepID=UPI001CC9C113|nr:hypothetical protein [Robertkochia sp. 3YJGBD-33]